MLTEERIHIRNTSPRRNFDRIICPTDLSPESDEALRYAVALARAYNAKLFICHSVEKPRQGWRSEIRALHHIKGMFEESLGPYISASDQPTLDWEGVVVEGDIAESISREAAERRADLIVMRSRRRPFAAAILGSNAEAI